MIAVCTATWGCLSHQSFWGLITRPTMHQPTKSQQNWAMHDCVIAIWHFPPTRLPAEIMLCQFLRGACTKPYQLRAVFSYHHRRFTSLFQTSDVSLHFEMRPTHRQMGSKIFALFSPVKFRRRMGKESEQIFCTWHRAKFLTYLWWHGETAPRLWPLNGSTCTMSTSSLTR